MTVRSPLRYRDIQQDNDLLIALHEPDARVAAVPEVVIQDIWRCLRFNHSGLTTCTGEAVEVWHPGSLNSDAGPDFADARIYVGDLCWSGDVEIHRTSGEWIEHRHDEDPLYDRVVLHVTLVADRYTGTLRRSDGTVLPEIVLYPLLHDGLRSVLHRFYATPKPDFFCDAHWAEVPEALRRSLMQSLGRERIGQRTAALADAYLESPDVEALLYRRVLRALGYAKNAEPMETLAQSVPLAHLRSFEDPRDVEALLLGAAGLLPSTQALLDADRATADYAVDLRDRFERMQARSPVAVMKSTVWKRARLRARSLPTRRIAQAAALVGPGGLLHADTLAHLVEAVQSERPIPALRGLLTATEPSRFWETHLRLDRACKPGPTGLGRSHADSVLINAVLPVLLLHAEQSGDLGMETLVLSLYEQLPAASDAVTRRFERHGTKPAHALEAQGLHQLYRTRCTAGRCLTCPVGQHVIAGEHAPGFGLA